MSFQMCLSDMDKRLKWWTTGKKPCPKMDRHREISLCPFLDRHRDFSLCPILDKGLIYRCLSRRRRDNLNKGLESPPFVENDPARF